MADDATTPTTTPEPAAPGNPEPTPSAPAATGGMQAQPPADPFAGLNLSAQDRATVTGLQGDPD